jgi:hypothetical protein
MMKHADLRFRSRPSGRCRLLAILLVGFLLAVGSHASGRTLRVNNMPELEGAIANARRGDLILIEEGVYTITGRFALQIETDNLTLQGASPDPTRTVIRGQGMQGGVNHGLFVAADRVTIRNLTVGEVANHAIQTHIDTDSLQVTNCVLRDAYEQLLKVPFREGVSRASENGVVDGCLFEYTAGHAPNWYTGGVDVHLGKGWVIRNNTFRNIQSPGESIAEHAIHFWSDSRDTLVEGNTIINCDRGIGFGLGDSRHTGGIIRNNVIVHDGSGRFPDVGIALESASGCRVYNNSIFFTHDRYPHAIEYRFPASRNNWIANNLTNRPIVSRDGGMAVLKANLTTADLRWFRGPVRGDLTLRKPVAAVVDQGVFIDGLVTDMAGNPRPLGLGIDIGAHEWLSDSQ